MLKESLDYFDLYVPRTGHGYSMTVEQGRQRTFVRQHEAALWLLLIVAVAAALRFTGLTFQSYWFDELYSAYYSNPAHSLARVIELTLADVHPPLHQLSMWISYKIFGYNEFAGRLAVGARGSTVDTGHLSVGSRVV